MKKNRPGVLVRVLGRPSDLPTLAEVLLLHTSALGVRYRELERLVAERSEATAETPWGPVRLKVKQVGQRRLPAPEYEDCARLARAAGVPLRAVYDAARAAFEA
jgi:pyridinium-3,5-bisthiocarboxylic acid mononucleotide nickel chelatase